MVREENVKEVFQEVAKRTNPSKRATSVTPPAVSRGQQVAIPALTMSPQLTSAPTVVGAGDLSSLSTIPASRPMSPRAASPMTRPGTLTAPCPGRTVGLSEGLTLRCYQDLTAQVSGIGSASMSLIPSPMVGASSPVVQVRPPPVSVSQPQLSITRKSQPTTSTRASSISTRTSSPGAAMSRASKFATVGQTASSHQASMRQVSGTLSQRSGGSTSRFPSRTESM